ncbi:aminopeptidase [Taibaiella sp. KBW10]|nr:aminopeptidase [Taibaiella sp. KBW10]
MDTLCSPYFWGRGYTHSGMQKAAVYLADVFKQQGLVPLNEQGYFQYFSYSTNTFPDKLSVTLNHKKLVPGKDFLVMAESSGLKGTFSLSPKDSLSFVHAKDPLLIVEKVRKLTWSPSEKVQPYTRIQVLDTNATLLPKKISINIRNHWIPDFKAANVAAMVKGTLYPDSFLVITAHYDHLGGMGKDVYFPGANDNASGVAMMLNLAQYYARHPQACSIVFIAFAGEEIGLKGSKYFTEQPLIPLERIKFLLNTDLAGTGSEGITVVNATEFPQAFALLQAINTESHLFSKVHSRGKAANSDHYFFTEKGVPAFFIYTQGGIAAYHDIYDRAATLPLDHQEQLFQLIVRFFKAL